MNGVTKPERRRLQFGIRRLLLWTAVAAVAFGVLSTLRLHVVAWAMLIGWFAVVSSLRWVLGTKLATRVVTVAGMLLYGGLLCTIAVTHSLKPLPLALVALAMLGCFAGGMMGFLSCVLVEAACRVVNRLDRIGQSDG